MTKRHPHLPDLSDKVVLITGGDGGIGSGLTRRFAEAGAAVVIHYLSDETNARTLADELIANGNRATIAQGDIRNLDACHAIVRTAVDEFGHLDALVNNAGVQPLQALEDMTVADWETVMAVNATGTFAMTQAAAAIMRTQENGGAITHIASIEASLPSLNHAHYAASKSAVKMHARAAALELGVHGIRVNTVSPGLIDRGDLEQGWPEGRNSWLSAVPIKRTGTPQDIADACIFLSSPLASWVSGHDLVVDGGMGTVPAW